MEAGDRAQEWESPLPPPESDGWGHDEWLEWLAEHPTVVSEGPARGVGPARSAPGSILAGAMWGLHEVFYGPRDDRVVFVQPAGEPDDDDRIRVHLDPSDPKESFAVIRRELYDAGPDASTG